LYAGRRAELVGVGVALVRARDLPARLPIVAGAARGGDRARHQCGPRAVVDAQADVGGRRRIAEVGEHGVPLLHLNATWSPLSGDLSFNARLDFRSTTGRLAAGEGR